MARPPGIFAAATDNSARETVKKTPPALQLGGVFCRFQRIQLESLILQQFLLVFVHGGLLFPLLKDLVQ
jgi:hypothetical protein